MTTYLSAINYRCKSCSFEGFSENFLVKKMIEGMRRLNKQKDTRLPISQGLLLKLINVLPYICSSIFEATLFSSAFSLAFHGFLRVGELVLSKRWQAHQVINIKDISIANSNDVEKIELRIAFSKTDQHGHGSNIQIMQDRTATCAVVLLKKYLGLRQNHPGPLYCHFDGSPVTRYQFSAVLNKALKFIGVDTSFIRTHSFRIGAASSHFDKGTSPEEIKKTRKMEVRCIQTVHSLEGRHKFHFEACCVKLNEILFH